MSVTGDQHLVKKINKTIVLNLIRSHSPISRADISARTGLNKGTVSSLVQELIDSRLVRELGPGASSGGRKPVLLAFDPGVGASIGIDLGVNYVLALLTGLDGAVIAERRETLSKRDYATVRETLLRFVAELRALAADRPYGVVGVGIGVPGMVDERGAVLFAPNLGWRGIPMAEELAARLDLPIAIDNEANFGAVGERQFGAGRDAGDMIYVSAGIGIGAGLILNGSLYKGAGGLSGEVGHMTVSLDGLPCSCGSRGCWELYASEQALLRLAEERLGRKPGRTAGREAGDGDEGYGLEELVAAAAANPQGAAASLFREIGAQLGVGIANLIHAFNPERVVIGNRLTLAAEWLEEPLAREVETRTFGFHRKRSRLEFSRLGIRATALGAAFAAMEPFFAETRVTTVG
ncbi:ROK family protein [Paenibacillus thermoaerophilus]|uniref:ROK family protein n=1 Tax=Paenibacillus thermoaerophilus TaxID=1215385 RepID=A0ABW2V3X9_9BACL|nr:ROK family transcriptional regulator [Paenibacillus thermoaerophilus]TMV18240.1 ROK family protein [Paenibacillus thermoaerophilus]